MVTNVAFDSLRPDVLPKRVARFKALSFGTLVMKPVRHKLRFWVAPKWKIQAGDVKVEAWGFGFGDPETDAADASHDRPELRAQNDDETSKRNPGCLLIGTSCGAATKAFVAEPSSARPPSEKDLGAVVLAACHRSHGTQLWQSRDLACHLVPAHVEDSSTLHHAPDVAAQRCDDNLMTWFRPYL